MSDLNMEVSSWSSAMVSSGQPGRLIRKGVTAFSFILAYLYPQSLHIYVSGSYGICRSASHLAGKRTPLMYQPALLSSPAKLLLGCISIAISNQIPLLSLTTAAPYPAG